MVDGVAEVSLPSVLLVDEQPLWTSLVIGNFIGDEAPHVGKFHAIVNKIWKSTEKSPRIDVQFFSPTSVLFRLEDEAMRARVIRRHFWHIAEVPLVVQPWTPKLASLKPDLNSIPIWVDFKDVPGDLYSCKGLSFLASVVGKPLKIHPNTERCFRLDVARVMVEVEFRKLLPSKIKLQLAPGVFK